MSPGCDHCGRTAKETGMFLRDVNFAPDRGDFVYVHILCEPCIRAILAWIREAPSNG